MHLISLLVRGSTTCIGPVPEARAVFGCLYHSLTCIVIGPGSGLPFHDRLEPRSVNHFPVYPFTSAALSDEDNHE